MTRDDVVELTWQVDDGYAGKDRPHGVDIHLEDIADCDTEQQVRKLVESEIREAFENDIAPCWNSSEEDRVVEAWKNRQKPEGGDL